MIIDEVLKLFRRNAMKKTLNFFTLPLVQVLVFGIGAACFYLFNRTGYELLAFIAIVIYILAGLLYAKIDDKKIRIGSIICAVLLLWIFNGVMAFLSLSDSIRASGSLLYFVILSNPVVTDIANRTIDLVKVDPTIYTVVLTVLSPISVAITVGAGKVFEMKKKTPKLILFIVMAAVCVAFLVLGIVDMTK